jgi:hypothetical protein
LQALDVHTFDVCHLYWEHGYDMQHMHVAIIVGVSWQEDRDAIDAFSVRPRVKKVC